MNIEPSITVRASSWAGLFDCAYRWEGIHLLGMKNTVGLRAALGTAIHAGTAAFDQAKITGDTVTAADAAGVAWRRIHHRPRRGLPGLVEQPPVLGSRPAWPGRA